MSIKYFCHQNYRWIVLVMGIFVVFSALGLARFGYSVLLPPMQESLGLNNSQAGVLATSNLTGYLAFSLLGGALASRFGIRLVVTLGLIMIGAGMILTSLADEYLAVALWRGLTGFGSGAANVAIMGLWAAWFVSKQRGLASGLSVSGSAFGLIFSGMFVPWIINEYGDSGWRVSWFVFGVISLILAMGAYLILRNNPQELGAASYGEPDSNRNPKPVGNNTLIRGSIAVPSSERVENPGWKDVYFSPAVIRLGIVYLAFGFSYIIYMTFFVKSLVSDHGLTASEAGKIFMLMGWFSIPCGLIWGTVSDYLGRKNTLIILYTILAITIGLFGLGNSLLHFSISAALFGITAWSIPAIMAATCGDLLGSKMAPAALGYITVFFGVGQAVSPVLSGIIADNTGSFVGPYVMGASVAFLGALGAAFLLKSDEVGRYSAKPPANL